MLKLVGARGGMGETFLVVIFGCGLGLWLWSLDLGMGWDWLDGCKVSNRVIYEC